MARIPGIEGLGQAVARPSNLSQVGMPSNAFGTGFGQALVDVGGQMLREEQRQAAEAEATRKAAEKVTALGLIDSATDDLSALSDDFSTRIRAGTLDKTQAPDEWATQARKRVNDSMRQMPAEWRQIAQNNLERRIAAGARGVQKDVTWRDQQKVQGGIDQQLERASRLYMSDPGAADNLVNNTLTQLGPASGLQPDQLQKKRQAYLESSRFTKGYTMVNDARHDNGALGQVEKDLSGPGFDDMDPQRKAQLLTTIEGYRVANAQRAEAEARRRQAEEERRLRGAESQFAAAQTLLSSGKVLSDAYVQQVSAAVAGTPLAAAFKESLKQGPENTQFGALPLGQQQAILQDARATLNTNGTDPATEKRYAQLQHMHDEAVRDYDKDPLVAAQERGVLKSLAPLDMSNPQTIAAGLVARGQQATIVQQQTGGAVSPLTQVESERFADMLAVLPVKQRSEAIATITSAIGGPTAQAMGKQIAGKDKALGLAFSAGSARTTEGRYTSELILRGAQAIKDKAIREDAAKVTGWRAEISNEIGDAYANAQMRDAVVDAAFYIRAGLASEDGSGNNSQAVRLASGGIVERNGRKVPLPYGMDADAFDKKLRSLPPASVPAQVFVAGKPMSGADFLARVPDAQLIHAGQGRYAVQAGGGLATTDGQHPLIIEVR